MRPTRENVSATREAYGYGSLVGLRGRDPVALRESVEAGLPYQAVDRLVAELAVPAAEVARLISIPSRTLARRKQEGRLQPDESDRVLRAARVLAAVRALFEDDAEAARRWLIQPQPALGGERPLDLMRTDVGSREVERLIERIEHGVAF